MLIFIVCVSMHIKTYGKYVFNKTFDVIQFNMDRQKPMITITQVKQERTSQTKQKITLLVNVEEKNLTDDTFLPNEIEIYVDNQQINLSELICIPKENRKYTRRKDISN